MDRRVLCLVLLCMVGLCRPGYAARILGQSIQPTQITVGDPITYRVVLEIGETSRVITLTVTTDDEYLEIDTPSIGTAEIPDSRQVRVEALFAVQAFSPGEHKIPEAVFQITASDGSQQTLAAPAYRFMVDSVLPAEAQDIRDIKPPHALKDNRWVYWLMAALALCVLGVFAFWFYRRHHQQQVLSQPPPPPRPAHMVALEALNRLEQSDLLAQDAILPFFVQLAAIVREYIEGRYQVLALESTTKEVLRDLEAHDLTWEARQLLEECLVESDLVKFARYLPSKPDAHQQVEHARRFVELTRSRFLMADTDEATDPEVVGE